MKKKSIEYQYPGSENSSLREPIVTYQQNILSREIPANILKDIQVSREEYKNGLAIPVSDFMKKYRNEL
ncbi:hypothetical protein [Parabacteroides goldsteinii]|uniref:hypothetical protein n=1 Tax=Parabacteroides goldsteinii TaxID=328812 RepID=UPI00321A0DC3